MHYASKTIVLPDVCYYCGGRSVSPLYNNAKIKQLKKEYTKVQPICTSYVTDGKQPVTWGACSNLVKKKKQSQTFSGILSFIIHTRFIFVYLYCLLTYLNS